MASLSGITGVKVTSNTTVQSVEYGATIAIGDVVYRDAADGKYKLADANASLATAEAKGIAITAGVDTDYGLIATAGDIVLTGTTMAVGETYHLGGTGGKIDPAADVASAWYVTVLGIGATSTKLRLGINATGILHA